MILYFFPVGFLGALTLCRGDSPMAEHLGCAFDWQRLLIHHFFAHFHKRRVAC